MRKIVRGETKVAKIQMGDPEEFWRILVEAERSLAAVAAG
jgi:hypothetical protein